MALCVTFTQKETSPVYDRDQDQPKKKKPMKNHGRTKIQPSKQGDCQDCGKKTMIFYDDVEKKWFCNTCS